MLTELGGSQVEVQRCSLSSEGPRLRSRGAQCAQTLAVEVTACGSWRRAWRRVSKAEVHMGLDAKVVEEKLEEEEKEVEDEEEEAEEENNCDKI